MQETWARFFCREDPLEKDMETYSSILAWRIPWTEEPSGLQSMRSQRIGHDWATNRHTHTHTHGPFKFRLWAKSGFHSSAQGSSLWQHPVPGTPGILLELLKINQPLIAYNSSNPEGNQSASMKSSDPLCHTSTKHFKVLSYASPHLQLSTVWSRESGKELLSMMQTRNWISFQVKWSAQIGIIVNGKACLDSRGKSQILSRHREVI